MDTTKKTPEKKKKTTEMVPAQEYEEMKMKYLRALADYQNMAKRIETERERYAQDATKQAVSSLIDIKDDVEKAEGFSNDPGLGLIKKKISSALERLGISEINPLNEPFLPETMECIHVVEGQPGNTVVKVHALGYKNGTILIRPATVTVQREPEIVITN